MLIRKYHLCIGFFSLFCFLSIPFQALQTMTTVLIPTSSTCAHCSKYNFFLESVIYKCFYVCFLYRYYIHEHLFILYTNNLYKSYSFLPGEGLKYLFHFFVNYMYILLKIKRISKLYKILFFWMVIYLYNM